MTGLTGTAERDDECDPGIDPDSVLGYYSRQRQRWV